MKHLPPLDDSILIALSRLIDDAQTGTREPSHSDIEFCITRCNLNAGDPKSQGQTFGKAKRVRTVLSWSIEHHIDGGRELVERITALVRGCGGFRRESPNYVGEDAIIDLRDALASEGFVLSADGELRPQVLESLGGVEMTEVLSAYARRAQKGSDDAALLRELARICWKQRQHMLFKKFGTTILQLRTFQRCLDKRSPLLD